MTPFAAAIKKKLGQAKEAITEMLPASRTLVDNSKNPDSAAYRMAKSVMSLKEQDRQKRGGYVGDLRKVKVLGEGFGP